MAKHFGSPENPQSFDFEQDLPSVQQIYLHAIDSIENRTGLKLNNLELAKLRLISQEVRSELVRAEPIELDNFSPIKETLFRFLRENYGIDENIQNWDALFEADSITRKPSDRVAEWFRQKQEEQFKP